MPIPTVKRIVRVEAVSVEHILRKINDPNKPKAIVLDACRSNPFEKKWTTEERSNLKRGFGDMESPRNVEILFSTQKNSEVRDDNPYIQYFMEELEKESCLHKIVQEVSKKIYIYNPNQIPAKYGQLFEDICFGDANNDDSPNNGTINNPSVISENNVTSITPVITTIDDCGTKCGNYNTKNDVDVLHCYKQEAKNGSVCIQLKLGQIYEKRGGSENYQKAKEWYRKAAENGNAKGQYKLGCLYRDYRLEGDYKNAIHWYKKAIENGYLKAQTSLGLEYYKSNEGDSTHYAKALHWTRKGVKNGDAQAQNNLGLMYDRGHGVEEDDDEAVFWYKKAAENGNAWGQYNLGFMYLNGSGVAKDYQHAINWFKRAAEQKNPSGLLGLGYMYENGFGVVKDKSQAIHWYKPSL